MSYHFCIVGTKDGTLSLCLCDWWPFQHFYFFWPVKLSSFSFKQMVFQFLFFPQKSEAAPAWVIYDVFTYFSQKCSWWGTSIGSY